MQEKRIDIDRLRRDTNTAEILFAVLHRIAGISENDFHHVGKYYQFKQASGLTVYKVKGQWVMYNYSDKASSIIGLPYKLSGDAINLCKLSTQDGFLSACKMLCDIARLNFDDYYQGNSSNIIIGKTQKPERKKRIEPDYTPNSKLNIPTINFQYSTSDSKVYQDIIQSYYGKWDITPETLKTFGIHPLARTIKKAKEKDKRLDYRYTAQRPAVIFKAGDNVKMKTISGKKKLMFSLVSAGNYVFGYDQLPETGDVLIFVEGEKDTLIINQHFNQYGIHAVTLGSAGLTINGKWLNELQSRFNRVIMMLDNDISGRNGMNKNRDAHPSLYVYDMADIVNDADKFNDCQFTDGINKTLNDIADVYEYNHKLLKDIITDAVLTTSIHADPLNRFTVPIERCYTFTIQKYLGEEVLNKITGKYPSEIISQIISDHDRVYLNSYTGTGKSWLFKSFMNTSWLHIPEIKRVIIAAPTTTIVEQLYNDYVSDGVDAEIVAPGDSDHSYLIESGTKIIITTWDSLIKISFALKDSLLVVDEAGEMTSKESGYRSKAINSVFDLIPHAKRTLFLSATPHLINCSNIDIEHDKYLYDFTLIKVYQDTPQAYNVTPYLVQAKKDLANVMQHHQDLFQNGLHLIKYDNVSMLEAYKAKTDGTIFSSKDKKYSDENPAYQSVINDGIVPDGINHIYTTSKFTSGGSIRQKVDSIVAIDETSAINHMQLMSRGRMKLTAGDQAKNINERIDYYLYNIGKSTDVEEYNREINQSGTSITDIFIEEINTASKLVDIVNSKRDLDITKNVINISDTIDSYVRYSKINGEYKINHVSIFNQIERYKSIQIGYAGMLKELRELHPAITINPPVFLDAPNDTDVSDQYKLNKELAAQKREELKELLVKDSSGFLISAYGLEKNVKTIKRIKTLIDVQSAEDQYRDVLDIHYHDVLKTLLYLNIQQRNVKTKQNWLSLDDAAKLVQCCHQKEVVSIQDRINTQFRMASYKILLKEPDDKKATDKCLALDLPVLPKTTQEKMRKLTDIKTGIQRIQRRQKKNNSLIDGCIAITKRDLIKELKLPSNTDVMSIIKTLYHTKYISTDHLWLIGKPHSIKSAIQYGKDKVSQYVQKSSEESQPISNPQISQNH